MNPLSIYLRNRESPEDDFVYVYPLSSVLNIIHSHVQNALRQFFIHEPAQIEDVDWKDEFSGYRLTRGIAAGIEQAKEEILSIRDKNVKEVSRV